MRQSAAARRPGVLGGLGSVTYRKRRLTLLLWVIGLIGLVFAWVQFGAPASNSFTGSDPGQAILNRHFPRQSGDALTLAIRSSAPVTAPAVRAQVTGALDRFRGAPHVSAVSDPYATPGQVSRDGHIAYATVQFSVQAAQIPGSEVTALMKDATSASRGGVTFALGGDVVDLAETTEGGPTDGVGVTAAAIVLLIAFGSVLAMGLPLVTAIFGIGTGLALIALLGHIFPAPSFSPIVASLIGLGVGIDYALFIVTRFRDILRDGASGHDACVAAMRTAGRSVLTAGTTVVIGMLGLLVLRQPLINGVAIAAAATVAMTVLAALTLLPALLGFTGTRLAKPSRLTRPSRQRRSVRRAAAPPAVAGRPSAAERWSGVVQRRPVVAAVLATAALLLLAAPALSMKLNMPDDSAQARGTMGYASYAALAQGFGPGFDAPLIVAASVPSPQASTTPLAHAVAGTRGVARVTPARLSPDGKAVMLIAYPTTGEQDTATNALVNKLNQTVLPRATASTGIRAYVTG
ncbi:MAG TPA: MMPL family transporter, partial [Streptosporangiaceae bacterium]|nr:MMPL family transporter [Streptosporangiaceae bacterium]